VGEVTNASIRFVIIHCAYSAHGLLGCGTHGLVHVGANSPDAGPFSLSGYVLKGPVSGATVTAFQLRGDLRAGDAPASGITDETGFFGLELPPYNGDDLLVARGGTYAEEALPADQDGNPRRLTLDRDFLGVALDVRSGQPTTANVTPISQFALHLAPFSTRREAITATRLRSTPSRI
jgi:hypothetical protein